MKRIVLDKSYVISLLNTKKQCPKFEELVNLCQ